MKTLLVATKNKGKAKEIREILAPYGVEVRTLNDYPHVPDVVEDGDTFLDNARKKAVETFGVIGEAVLADDSGLVVAALGDAPGVHSARYAGEQANDADNNQKLLVELAALNAITPEQRGAKFVCTMVFFDGHHEIITTGEVAGTIGFEPKGTNGFGYDPLFIVSEKNLTAAQLPADEKNAISHRGQALRTMIRALEKKEVIPCLQS